MSRKFIAAVVATSIAITTYSAAPARALDGDDAAKLMFGAAALFIIGKAITDNDRDRGYEQPDRRYYPQQPTYRSTPPRYYDPKRRNQRTSYELPASCLRYHPTRSGRVRMMGEQCLQKNYRHANRLPRKCRITARTNEGRRYGYAPQCLRQQGYRLAHK